MPGVEALKAHNLFYHLTYDHNDGHESSITASTSSSGSTTMSLDAKQSQLEREARDVQVGGWISIDFEHKLSNCNSIPILLFIISMFSGGRIWTNSEAIVLRSSSIA